MQIHSRKMNVSPDVNFDELARSTDDFNGAQCKVKSLGFSLSLMIRKSLGMSHINEAIPWDECPNTKSNANTFICAHAYRVFRPCVFGTLDQHPDPQNVTILEGGEFV